MGIFLFLQFCILYKNVYLFFAILFTNIKCSWATRHSHPPNGVIWQFGRKIQFLKKPWKLSESQTEQQRRRISFLLPRVDFFRCECPWLSPSKLFAIILLLISTLMFECFKWFGQTIQAIGEFFQSYWHLLDISIKRRLKQISRSGLAT